MAQRPRSRKKTTGEGGADLWKREQTGGGPLGGGKGGGIGKEGTNSGKSGERGVLGGSGLGLGDLLGGGQSGNGGGFGGSGGSQGGSSGLGGFGSFGSGSSGGGNSGNGGFSDLGSGSSGGGPRRGSRMGCLTLIIIALIFFFVVRPMLSNLFGGSSTGTTSNNTNSAVTTNNGGVSFATQGSSLASTSSSGTYTTGGNTIFGSGSSGTTTGTTTGTETTTATDTGSNSGGYTYADLLTSLLGGNSTGWVEEDNTGSLNTTVATNARDKYTTIRGDGTDTVTVMVYMCGSDLESRSGMATSDLFEMQSAKIGDNVNVIVYTGGCSRWQNNVVSSRYNQIYQVKNGVKCIYENAGTGSMTDPNTLASFIQWTGKSFPANRMILIMWDHGAGSVSGYGYDEKNVRSDTMTLDEIKSALDAGGVKFDFIGFDACLMATAETALLLDNYADYMIASEETEPGIGWYYTNWLTNLSADTSLPTLQIGKQIIDDYTSECAKKCRGMETTLSIVDLAELSATLPDQLAAFSKKTSAMIAGGDYQTVATARGAAHEFARSTVIDQIDLVHFAQIMNTSEGNALVNVIRDAVKYNKTSSQTANANGLSIYFPYRKVRNLDSMIRTYKAINMDTDYMTCIRSFAQVQVSGQATANASSDPFSSLFGGTSFGGGSYTGSSYSDTYTGSGTSISGDAMMDILSALLGGGSDMSSLGLGRMGLDASNTEFLTEGPLDADVIASYIEAERLTQDDLSWKEREDGTPVIALSADKWAQVQGLDMAMYFDDGEGYIELGLDNLYDFDEGGNMVPCLDTDWLCINGQPVAYYHTDTMDAGDDNYRISGYVPVLVNGEQAELILVFDNENEDGYIAGVRYVYDDADTEGKAVEGLAEGDVIDFIASYYGYDGSFQSNYKIGNPLTVEDPEALTISNLDLSGNDGSIRIIYRFVDMYGQVYWTEGLDL